MPLSWKTTTHDLTLDQLATLADYKPTTPAVAVLIGAAKRGPGTLNHAVAGLRQDTETRARTQALLDDLTARGIPVTAGAGSPGSGSSSSV